MLNSIIKVRESISLNLIYCVCDNEFIHILKQIDKIEERIIQEVENEVEKHT